MGNVALLLRLSLMGVLVWSFTLTGCGEKGDKSEDQSTADSTAETAGESTEAGGDVKAKFKSGMIDMAKEMVDIAEDVESVQDAEKAEPRIEKMMGDIAAIFTALADDFEDMSIKDAMALRNMEDIAQDPEVKEWGEKAEAAMDKLKAEHPEAAAKLEEIGNKHSQKFMDAMMAVSAKIQQKVQGGQGMGSAPEGDTAGK